MCLNFEKIGVKNISLCLNIACFTIQTTSSAYIFDLATSKNSRSVISCHKLLFINFSDINNEIPYENVEHLIPLGRTKKSRTKESRIKCTGLKWRQIWVNRIAVLSNLFVYLFIIVFSNKSYLIFLVDSISILSQKLPQN